MDRLIPVRDNKLSIKLKLENPKRLLVNIALIFGLLLIIVMVTVTYVSSEHIYYWSDYSGYQDITHGIVEKFHASPIAALKSIAYSTTQEYNAIFTIPIVPFILIFGDTRIVFEIALAVVYLFPFILLLGSIATKLINIQPVAVFWSTVAVAILTPVVWVPTLRGYPDTGGAVLILLAVRLYLEDTRLKKWWQVLFIGFLITFSILFRRHFAYAGIAFFCALGLAIVLKFGLKVKKAPREALVELRSDCLQFGLTIGSAFVTLILFGLPFLLRALSTDYIASYASYMEPFGVVLEAYAEYYGWLSFILVGLGGIGFVYNRKIRREGVIFLSLYGGLALLLWVLVVGQISVHYTLHFTPVIVLTLVLLIWTVRFELKRLVFRVLAISIICLYLASNLLFALNTAPILTDSVSRSFFAVSMPPLTRPDYAEVAKLVAYLRDTTTASEPIYVAASSDVLGTSMLANAETDLYGWNGTKLNILQAPAIDSRDPLPLEFLLKSQYVIIVNPFQHHLEANRQLVVKVVLDIFNGQQEFAQDFTQLPVKFSLQQGATVNVYKRFRPTSTGTATNTLNFIQNYMKAASGT